MYSIHDKSFVNNDLMNRPDKFNKVHTKIIIPYINQIQEELKISDFLKFVPGIIENVRGSGDAHNLIQLNMPITD